MNTWKTFADFIDSCCRQYADDPNYRRQLMQELPKHRRDLLAHSLPPLRRPPRLKARTNTGPSTLTGKGET